MDVHLTVLECGGESLKRFTGGQVSNYAYLPVTALSAPYVSITINHAPPEMFSQFNWNRQQRAIDVLLAGYYALLCEILTKLPYSTCQGVHREVHAPYMSRPSRYWTVGAYGSS